MIATEHYKLIATIDILDRLKGGGERRSRLNEIRQILELMTEGHLFLGSNLQDGTLFYRGRLLQSKQPFSNLNQLTLRKSSDVTDFGRCNAPGDVILYASSNLETVFSEVGIQIDGCIQLIKLRKKDGVDIKCTVIGDIDHVRRYGRSSLGGEGFTVAVQQYWDSLSELERLRLNLTDAFVAERFRSAAKHSFEYKVTSIFSSIVFAQGFDAFYYPSVGHLGGWNIAISEDAFKRGFDVIESEVREVFDSPGYGIFGSKRLLESEKIIGDSIEWKTVSLTHAFPSFDYYIWYHLSVPGQKTVLFQVLKNAKVDRSKFRIEAMPAKGTLEPNDLQTITQLSINGSFTVGHDKDFKALSQFISTHVDSWDYVVCDVIPSTLQNEIQNGLAAFVQQVSQGGVSYSTFDREGNSVTPVFGSPAHIA